MEGVGLLKRTKKSIDIVATEATYQRVSSFCCARDKS